MFEHSVQILGVVQDGLFLVTNNLDLVSGYTLAVLTPNVNEYKRLVQKALSSEVNDADASQQLLSLAKQLVPCFNLSVFGECFQAIDLCDVYGTFI